MLYTLTDKLEVNENPVIEVMGKKLTVQADAETVLKLLDIVERLGETKASMEATDLLFNDKDRKALSALKLSWVNFTKVLNVAIALALGDDPDDDAQGEQ